MSASLWDKAAESEMYESSLCTDWWTQMNFGRWFVVVFVFVIVKMVKIATNQPIKIIQILIKWFTIVHNLMHEVQIARSPTIVKCSCAQWCRLNGTFKKKKTHSHTTFLSLHFQQKKAWWRKYRNDKKPFSLAARACSLAHIKHQNDLKQISKEESHRTKQNRSTAVIYCMFHLMLKHFSRINTNTHSEIRLHALISFHV